MDKRYVIYSIIKNNNFIEDDILKIIIEHNIEYSTNNNGLFINLSMINNTIIDEIYTKIISIINYKPYTINDTNLYIEEYKYIEPEYKDIQKDILKLTPLDKKLLLLSRQTLTI